jgi:putative oxidoreductase
MYFILIIEENINMSSVALPLAAASVDSKKITATDWALLILRVVLGVVFIAHGAQKLFGWFGGYGLAGTVGFFTKMGIPVPLAYLAIFTEFFGGLAVLFGVLGRLAALGIAVNMLVAIFKVHLPHGFFLDHMGFEYAFTCLGLALAVVMGGPGRVAVADIEPKWLRRR